MANPQDADVWVMIFEQTPRAVRWLFGLMTFGLFTLASVLYRWQRDDNKMIHARMDNLERRIDSRLDEVNGHLIEIARNTRR